MLDTPRSTDLDDDGHGTIRNLIDAHDDVSFRSSIAPESES